MNKKISILLALFVLSFSTIVLADPKFYREIEDGRFDEALKMLRTPNNNVDVKYVPRPGARSAATMALDAGQDELVQAIWLKMSPFDKHFPREDMLQFVKPGMESEAKKKFPTGLESDEMGTRFVHWVCLEGDIHLLKYYLERLGDAEIPTDINGDALLNYAIHGDNAENRNAEVVEYLIGLFADLEGRNAHGETPLMVAATSGATEIAQMLIHAGAQIEAKDFDGATALHYAAWYGTQEIVALLIKAGANRNAIASAGSATALLAAVRNGQLNTFEMLFGGSDLRWADKDGLTVLHFAAAGGNKEIVEKLYKAGADVNARSSGGLTPLHAAATHGQIDAADQLIRGGAYVNERTPDGDTALHIAAQGNNEWMVRLLATTPAVTVDLRNGAGKTPAELTTDKKIKNFLNRKITASPLVTTRSRKRVEAPTEEPTVTKPAEPKKGKTKGKVRPAASVQASAPVAETARPPRKAAYVHESREPMDLGPDEQAADFHEMLQFNAIYERNENFLNVHVRARTHIRNADATQTQVRVIPIHADGNCGFHVLDVDRAAFINAVLNRFKELTEPGAIVDPQARKFLKRIREEMQRLGAHTIEEWAVAYARTAANGHSANWVDERVLKMMSYLFNFVIHVYNVDPNNAHAFIAPMYGQVIYNGTNPATAREFAVAHVPVEPGEPATHYEGLQVVQAAPVAVPADLAAFQQLLQGFGNMAPMMLQAMLIAYNAGKGSK
jgi:ankyrin repeat protein